MHARLVMSVGLCLSYVPIGWAWGDTHMMMKSGVVFFMCCFPYDIVAFLRAIGDRAMPFRQLYSRSFGEA